MVQINLLGVINESVDQGMKKTGLPNTPKNRIDVLWGMHKKISGEGLVAHNDRFILLEIEDEIVRLQDTLA